MQHGNSVPNRRNGECTKANQTTGETNDAKLSDNFVEVKLKVPKPSLTTLLLMIAIAVILVESIAIVYLGKARDRLLYEQVIVWQQNHAELRKLKDAIFDIRRQLQDLSADERLQAEVWNTEQRLWRLNVTLFRIIKRTADKLVADGLISEKERDRILEASLSVR